MKFIIPFLVLLTILPCFQDASAAWRNPAALPIQDEFASGLTHRMINRQDAVVELVANLWGTQDQDRLAYDIFYDILRTLHGQGFIRDYRNPATWDRSMAENPKYCLISINQYDEGMGFVTAFKCGRDGKKFAFGTDEYQRLRYSFFEKLREEFDRVNRQDRYRW